MTTVSCQSLAHDITCLDALYTAPGMACFYLVGGDDEYAVIETGTSHSVPVLLEFLSAQGIERSQLRYVVPTHAHLDHAGGAGAIMQACPEARLLAHPSAAGHLVEPARLLASARAVYGEAAFARLYGEVQPIPAERVDALEDGARFALGTRQFEVRHTRGHANHHFCVWDERSRGWFSGDMFGLCYADWRFPGQAFVMPSTTPTQFDPAAFAESLALLASYGPDRLYLTHYGELAWSDSSCQALAVQVAHYAQLATDTGPDEEALQRALLDYTLPLIRQLAPVIDQDSLLPRLVPDLQLNAQGLKVWLQRRER
jgi:glyoxylase-like metal-dependent hydrolase (beta-lactamase superfamily II)